VPGIVPLRSNVTTLNYATLAPGPDFTPLAAASGQLEAPSAAERRLRTRIGRMIADQVVEDDALGLTQARQGYHAYNAALRRILGKSRAAMTLAELEAAVGWLERNRLRDHVQLLETDAQYRWSRTQQKWQSAARRRWKAR
jgi:hypothetical protein